jgi:putative ABC transport system substrate-binding protein
VRRRQFITLLGGAATWPVLALAQRPNLPTIGLLGAPSAQGFAPEMAAFRQGLREVGYREGANVAIEYRWANNNYSLLPGLAADLAGRPIAVMTAVGGNPASLAAQAATKTIPVVFYVGADPVELGLVASLNRPAGNLTGIAGLNVEVGPKRLELMHELVPSVRVVALLVNPTNQNAEKLSRDVQAAAEILGVQVKVVKASTERDFETAFANVVQLQAGALLIGGDALFRAHSNGLATLALHHKLPAIFQYHEFAAAGGLMSYGGSLTDAYRLVGIYTGRVLKGERPADLPVQQSTKVELIINLKTAKVLGIDVPATLLARADQVIE